MKPEHRIAVRGIGLALGCLALVSCQTSTEPVPTASGPMVATVKFGVAVDHYPDSADWSSSKQSGAGGLACADGYCTDTLRLRDTLGAGGAQLRLWSLGVRIATLELKQEGRSTTLAYSIAKDTFELRVLDDFLAFRQTRSDSFAKVGPIGASHLVAFYAAQVLSGRSGYTGFPGILPVGMKTDSVKRAIVALGPGVGLTSSRLAGLGLGLDSSSIRVFAAELFAKGKLSASDTLALFPPPPVRVFLPLSVAGELVPGGAAVPVSGSFSWNKGRTVSAPTITVRTPDGVDPLFTSSAKKWPASADTSWTLTDNVKLSAPIGATPGMDTLSVILSTDSGYAIEARAIFRVVSRDVVPPVLRISRPGQDTAVPNETYSVVVEAIGSDSSGIDSVRIRNKTLRAAPYLDTVFLVVGENQVVAQAWDRYGNSSFDTVRIARAKAAGDTTPPKIVRISPVADTSVPWSTKSLALSWAITDDSPLQRVTLDSVVLSGASGHFLSQVPLPVGSRTFVLVATDSKGNTGIDSVRVLRKADTVKPEIRFVSPSADTSVPHPVGRIRVVVAAEDAEAGLDSVKIGATKHIASPFADTIELSTGSNRVVVQAWDKAGNRAERVLLVERGASPGDTTAPVVERLNPTKDTAVGWGTKTFSLSYSISDDSLLSKVWLNDSLWTGDLGSYQRSVGLAVGTNVFRVAAQDARGNRRLDTLRIVRASDTIPPVLEFAGPSKDTSVVHGIGKILVSAKGSDANGIDSIRIGTNTHASDAASDSIALITGVNKIVIQAWDKAGNRTERVLTVERGPSPGDTTAPVIKRLNPTKDTAVGWGTKTFSLSYSISDDSLLSKVWLNDSICSGTDGVCQRTVGLLVGTNLFRIAAQDLHGNRSLDTLRIVRASDVLPPVLEFAGPSKDSSVAFDVGKILVSAKGSDANGIDSIRIGTNTHASDAASDSIALVTGVNKIVIKAWDKAGNLAVDTLRITRARDMVLPKIVRATGASNQVLPYPSSSNISWTVTDNDALSTVTIQGVAAQGNLNVYTASVPVLPGRFSIVVVATDRAGNKSTDTVWWTGQLYDSRDRKSYRIASMPDGKVWMAEDLAFVPASCGNTCVDSFYTWSQAMALPDSCDGAVCKVDTTVAIKGACPTNWHLPTGAEWKSLVTNAGIVHLKSATAWIKNSNGIITDYNGDDLYGFNLLPRSPDCSAGGCSMAGKWWTTYQDSDSNAGDFQVSLDASWQSRGKWLYMNVRCVRD